MILETIKKARAAGAEVVDFGLPSEFSRMNAARDVINNVERARAMAWEWTHHRSALSPQLTQTIEAGLATDEDDYRDALRFLDSARHVIDERFRGLQAIITPTVNGEAPKGQGSTGDASLQGLWTALYTPSISLPAAQGPNKMPIGVQLVAPRGADRTLLEVALWMQKTAGMTAPAR
jgi:Asp-tRNA(Asn)/Glu-tRNA(Gln) amidotransferase A subunit family amidase